MRSIFETVETGERSAAMIKLFQQKRWFIFPYLFPGVLSLLLAIPIVRAAPTNDLRLIGFREFITQPPPYVEARIDQYIPGFATNQYLVRWQKNAGLCAKYLLPPKKDIKEWGLLPQHYRIVISRFHQVYYYVNQNTFLVATNTSNTFDVSPFNIYENTFFTGFALLLNLGNTMMRGGGYHWIKGKLVGTNDFTGCVVIGTPKEVEGKRIKSIVFQCIRPGILKKDAIPMMHNYFYENKRFPNLPSRVEIHGSMPMTIFLKWLEISSKPKGAERFRLRLEDFWDRVKYYEVLHNNQYITIVLTNNQISFRKASPRRISRPLYKNYRWVVLLVLSITVFLPLIWIAAGIIKKRKNTE